jgi:hypothetical protein
MAAAEAELFPGPAGTLSGALFDAMDVDGSGQLEEEEGKAFLSIFMREDDPEARTARAPALATLELGFVLAGASIRTRLKRAHVELAAAVCPGARVIHRVLRGAGAELRLARPAPQGPQRRPPGLL